MKNIRHDLSGVNNEVPDPYAGDAPEGPTGPGALRGPITGGTPMHAKPISESDGDWEPCDMKCPGCGEAGHVFCRIWESSCGGYEDFRYECRKCGNSWWIEGPDA